MLVMFAVLPGRWSGFGPVTLLPLTMYSHEPSALRVTSCGSYAVGMRPVTSAARRPDTGITAIELAPLFTAYRVSPSGESVTAEVPTPVYFRPGRMPFGARASILTVTRFTDVSITAT